MKCLLILFLAPMTLFSCTPGQDNVNDDASIVYDQMKKLEYSPETYVCYKTPDDLVIDGQADEPAWHEVPYTNYFKDIEGDKKPQPSYDTRAKMLWNDRFLYIYAKLKEPHIWAKLTRRDTVIYYDNDFEVFIDPDGDHHGYYELEVNARNVVWDLMLIKPYRDGGPPVTNWDIHGLRSAVKIHGTLNDPSDTDEMWTVEIAIPMDVLEEHNFGEAAGDGVQWRINFSRVEWKVQIVDGRYEKRINPATGKRYREDNWVWSPQGVIDMHRPETWGYVQFSEVPAGTRQVSYKFDEDEKVKWELMNIYHAQRAYRASVGKWAAEISALEKTGLDPASLNYFQSLQTTHSLYELTSTRVGSDCTWHLDEQGKLWKTEN